MISLQQEHVAKAIHGLESGVGNRVAVSIRQVSAALLMTVSTLAHLQCVGKHSVYLMNAINNGSRLFELSGFVVSWCEGVIALMFFRPSYGIWGVPITCLLYNVSVLFVRVLLFDSTQMPLRVKFSFGFWLDFFFFFLTKNVPSLLLLLLN